MKKKRPVEVVVISDVHLGTYGCHAKELLKYLKTIKPKILILNGDIIDVWQFKKRYWPKSHMQIIKYIMGLLSKGTKVYYVTGNHDEMFRRFVGFQLGDFEIVNKVVLNLDGKKHWIFHGDVFDVTMQHSKWLARLGAWGYDSLILINSFVNFFMKLAGKQKLSLSKKIKNSVKSAVKYINNFENVAAELAIEKEYHAVICGHIHQPCNKQITLANGNVQYLNSGDWVENLTSLEYNEGVWRVYEYHDDNIAKEFDPSSDTFPIREYEDIFKDLVSEFLIKSA